MTLDEIRKRLGTALATLEQLDSHLAAPVDLLELFGGGVQAVTNLDAATPGKQGVFVDGSVTVKAWKVTAHTVVTGDVSADSIELERSLLVVGKLSVRGDVIGVGEPHVLTVLGEVDISRAIMTRQFIMQFLGGGHVGVLADEDGGGQELVGLLAEAGSKLAVGQIVDMV